MKSLKSLGKVEDDRKGHYESQKRKPAVPHRVRIKVEWADVLSYPTDVLILKHAQALYGVDKEVVRSLRDVGVQVSLPANGALNIVETAGAIAARAAMFVGVEGLRHFGYAEIREFATRSIAGLPRDKQDLTSIAFTVHGPGYGLDENESFESQLAGILDALESQTYPTALQTISIVELDAQRAHRLRERLAGLRLSDDLDVSERTFQRYESIRAAGVGVSAKSHVFVAMPFAKELDDTFHYGIQGASNSAGYLCERADLSSFAGDALAWVKDRISSAELVIADLTTANANVYLEVGYAWGCGVPTVLLVRDSEDLKFNVRGQRCIIYDSIKELEEKLSAELVSLKGRQE